MKIERVNRVTNDEGWKLSNARNNEVDPSYPSGHATTSSAKARVLGYLFPESARFFTAKAKEAADSRFEGGVHFRIDNEVGLTMGRQVGDEVVKRARQDGADSPPPLVQR